MGLCDHQLTPQEAAWVGNTPNIPWKAFSRAFGVPLYSERPIIRKVPAYKGSFICTNIVTQPFAPRHVGEPGVILFPPDAILLEESKDTFHVLVDPSPQKRTELQYCGIYTKVNTPDMEVQIDEWHALPSQCRTQWLKRLRRWEARDLHARCTLRKEHDSEPSHAEIREWLRKYHDGSVAMERFTLPDSFNSGAEKFGFEVIKCVGYDVELAKLLRDEANRLSN
ncbi:hypothetical protein BJY52DRAFT_592554 [Lactarius psammicola]|nr:hypothetical protein BJY52DRAFT_592554 [Lactarius psammicola]